MEIGFIGLGAMGLPMTRHLVEAGHAVTVSSRSPGPVEQAVALGARDGRSPAGVAGAAEVVILCVPSSPQVASVVDAMLSTLRPGQVVVDCSTIDPEVARAQHRRVTDVGAGFLDAPCPVAPPVRRRARSPSWWVATRRPSRGPGPPSTRSPGSSSTWGGPGWARWSSCATT